MRAATFSLVAQNVQSAQQKGAKFKETFLVEETVERTLLLLNYVVELLNEI